MNSPLTLTSRDQPHIMPDGHEVKTHGTTNIPFIIYRGLIPDFMPSYPLHYHDELEIICCIAGSGIIRIDGKDITVHAEEEVIILPGQIHSIDAKDKPFEYFNILFKFSLLEPDLEASVTYRQYLAPFEEGTVCIPPLIEKDSLPAQELRPHLMSLIHGRKDNSTLRIKSLLFAVMDLLHGMCVPVKANASQARKTHDFLKKAIHYINGHYDHTIHVQDIASYCSYSPSHFMRLFRDAAGTSFSQYLVHFRLEKAAMLLKVSGMPVIEAALSCGFENASYFTRAFRKQYGVTPSDFAKHGTVLPEYAD